MRLRDARPAPRPECAIAYGSLDSLGVEADSGSLLGSIGSFFCLVDFLGDSLAGSAFSRLVSVLALAFSDFFAGSSVLFFSLFDSALVEGLEVSLTRARVLAGFLEDDYSSGIGDPARSHPVSFSDTKFDRCRAALTS